MNNHMTTELDQDETLVLQESSDEAPESAGCAGNKIAGIYTLAACTGLSVCPG